MKNDYSDADDDDVKGERGTGRLAEQGIPAAVDRLGGRVQQVLSQPLYCLTALSPFLDTHVSLAPTHVSPLVPWSVG